MRGLAIAAVGLGVVSTAGCTTPDRFVGLEGAPGDYVSATSPFQRTVSGINPFSDYNTQYTLVRVVAPPGATKCRIADQSMFVPDGPKTEGAPDAKREVVLAYHAGADSAAFECKTPDGVVKRTVKAVTYEQPVSENAPQSFRFKTQVKPPLVHIDPKDPEAEQRWTALAAELCPDGPGRPFRFACRPGMFEKLKAEDLKASG